MHAALNIFPFKQIKLHYTRHVNTLELSDLMFTYSEGQTQPKQTNQKAKHNGKH